MFNPPGAAERFLAAHGTGIVPLCVNDFMRQMRIDPTLRVPIDLQASSTPESVRQLDPVLFKDGSSYICILGPDPQAGVYGSGESPQAALAEWDKDLHERLQLPENPQDDVLSYVRDSLQSGEMHVW